MDGKHAGWERFAAADWAGARDAFAAALEEEPGDPEALDGLGPVAVVARRARRGRSTGGARPTPPTSGTATRARRAACRLPRRRAPDRRPGRGGGGLAVAGAAAARRTQGAVPELGWLAIEEAKRAGDPAAAERHARAALAVAHELADPDVECMALAQLGRAVVRQGRVDEGIALLDEAMTVALGGESSDPARVRRRVLHDARRLRRPRRPRPRRAVVRGGRRVHRAPPLHARPVVVPRDLRRRARARRRLGAGRDGARRGAARHADRRRGGGRALPLAVLAELRLRQGRTEEAERLLAGLDDDAARRSPRSCSCTSSAATSRTRRRCSTGASSRLTAAITRRRTLAPLTRRRRRPARPARRGRARGGRPRRRRGAAERLRSLAERLARDDLARRGRAARGPRRGRARRRRDGGARARGRRRRLRRPALPARGGPRAARARGRRRPRRARRSRSRPRARRATRFERLGARRDADEAAALLRDLGASGRTAARGDRDELTLREREVLDLVGGRPLERARSPSGS